MFSVRSATVDDTYAVATVHVRSWQVGYRGLIPDEFLEQMRAEDRAERYRFAEVDASLPHTIVATEGDRILGFATLGASRDVGSLGEGEIFALYVDPDTWGKGVGRTLIANARTRLAEMSFSTANLWVLHGNQRAIRFYGSDGWTCDGSSRDAVVWGVAVNEIHFHRSLP